MNPKTVKSLRILYPMWMLVGMFSIMYVPGVIMVDGDALKTAENLADHQLLYRFGILGSLVTQLFFIIIPLLLFRLLRKVSELHASMMLAFALVSIPITMYNDVNKLSALSLINEPAALMEMLQLHDRGMLISLLFWGLWLFPLGILVYRSGLFPRWIGISVIIGGVGYILDVINRLFAIDSNLLESMVGVMTLGEVVFILWLVIAGVRKGAE